MKKIVNKLFILGAAISIIGCSTEPIETIDKTSKTNLIVANNVDTVQTIALSKMQATCAYTPLMAGQDYIAGAIYVTVEDNSLKVTYTTSGNWNINATHLYLGTKEDMPLTSAGNPRIGHFPNATTHVNGTTQVTYVFDYSDLDDCFVLAAHAEVSLIDANGNVLQSETAWGQGTDFEGRSWAMYSNVCKLGCTKEIGNPVIK